MTVILYFYALLPFLKLCASLADPCKSTVLRREALNISVERKDLSIAKGQSKLRQIIMRLTDSTMSLIVLLHPSRRGHPRAQG